MHTKRWLPLLYCLLIAIALAACQPKAPVSTPAADPTPGASTQDEPAADEAAPPDPAADYSEPMVISYAAVAMTEGLDYNADDLSRIFLEKFNMQWDTIGLTWDNWGERVRIWVNANDMPDFVMMNFNYTDIKNYAEQGLLRPFPPGWEARYPNLYRIHRDTGLGEAVAQRVGGVYMLPRIVYFTLPTDPLVSHPVLWYRADWAEAVGITPDNKFTVNEVMEMARRFRDQRPGGEAAGNNVPLSIGAGDLASVFISPFNVNHSGYYKGEDGRYHWGGEDPRTLEGLRVYRQAYEEGLLNPDFFALKNNEEKDDFNTGRAGAMYNGGFAKILKDTYPKFETNTGLDPFRAIKLAYITDAEGNYNGKEITNYWSVSIFSPKMAEAKYTRLLDLLEYASTEEGQTLIRFGIEGVDWRRNASGGIEIIRETIEDGSFINLQNKYPSLNPVYNNLTVLPDDFSMNDPTTDERILNICKELFAGKQRDGFDKGKLTRVDYDVTLFSAPNFDKTSINYGDEYARLVVGEGDIEANWQAWIAEKRAQIDAVLAELNEAYAR